MPWIKVQIVKYISDHQSGFVECSFSDAWNKQYIVYEKVPVVKDKDLNVNSHYPQNGFIDCEIIERWKDKDGRIIFTVYTEKTLEH